MLLPRASIASERCLPCGQVGGGSFHINHRRVIGYNFTIGPTFHHLNLSPIIATEVTLMHSAYIVTGTLTDAQTVSLDEALPLTPTKVRLVIEPLLATSPRQYQEVIAKIRERQRTRGHKPPTREEVDAYLQAERDSWEE
jgi:hypothetical protein